MSALNPDHGPNCTCQKCWKARYGDLPNPKDEAAARIESLAAENEALRGALIELVACKDLKDMLDLDYRPEYLAIHGNELDSMRAEYERRKPRAWDAARAAIDAAIKAKTAGGEGK